MKLFSRQKTQERRPRIAADSPSKAPIMRYYRPESLSSTTTQRAHKEAIEQEGLKARLKSKNWTTLFTRSIGVIAILFVILANFTLSGLALNTTKQNASTSAFRNTEVYEETVSEFIENSLLNRTKLTFNSKKLEAQIYAAFPEVSQANAIIPLVGRKIDVRLQFDIPMMRIIDSDNKQGLVGQNGVLLLQDEASVINERFAGLPSLSLPGVEVQEGEQILTNKEAELLLLLISEFDGSQKHRPKLQTVEFIVEKREVRVRFEKRPFHAKLTPERDSREQVGSLVSALKSLEKQGRRPSSYIDVRVDERIYAK